MISERGECYMGKSESVSADPFEAILTPYSCEFWTITIAMDMNSSSECHKKSDGRYELKEPSLYTSLRRLEGQQCIESYWGDESQGGRRKYYRITPAGRSLLQANLAAWNKARDLIEDLLKEET